MHESGEVKRKKKIFFKKFFSLLREITRGVGGVYIHKSLASCCYIALLKKSLQKITTLKKPTDAKSPPRIYKYFPKIFRAQFFLGCRTHFGPSSYYVFYRVHKIHWSDFCSRDWAHFRFCKHFQLYSLHGFPQ